MCSPMPYTLLGFNTFSPRGAAATALWENSSAYSRVNNLGASDIHTLERGLHLLLMSHHLTLSRVLPESRDSSYTG